MYSIDLVLIAGLATGFWTYFFVDFEASPRWWKWLAEKVGKPFSCRLCTSFWLAIVFVVMNKLQLSYFTIYDLGQLIAEVSAAAIVSLITVALLIKLNIFVLR